jgi:hypothetical protein
MAIVAVSLSFSVFRTFHLLVSVAVNEDLKLFLTVVSKLPTLKPLLVLVSMT